MNDLRTAAQQALEALRHVVRQAQENLVPTIHYGPVNDVMNRLEAALAEPAQQGCDHCNHPLYAAVKCRVCGRVTEPVQEPCTYKCETWPECECAKPWQSAPPQCPAEPVQEPVAVTVEAVAEVIEKDGEPELCWLIEGGIYALAEGDILMIAHRSITGDDGSGEVYTAPPQNKENT